MTKINKGRKLASPEGDFVVFLIGMRINNPILLNKWVPVAKAMGKMQQELAADLDLGCLSVENWFGRTTISLQYWASFEQLDSYSRAPEHLHLPAWREFNRSVKDNPSVGIWHETYQVEAAKCESIYSNMHDFGLGRAFSTAQAHKDGKAPKGESV